MKKLRSVIAVGTCCIMMTGMLPMETLAEERLCLE